MKPVVINDMETISITYRGLVHKLTEYEKLADTIETIYAMCDQKITHWADSITGKKVNPQLQVYDSLCSERDKLVGIDFQNRRYNEIGKPYHAVIYCDAPYRNVKQYTMVEPFDFEAYDNWLIEMAKDNLVLISEYSMMGNHVKDFIQLDEWTLNKSIGAGQTDDETSIERLYYVKGGWLTDKYFNNTENEELEF